MRIWCRMPLSVATINSLAGLARAYSSKAAVEPTLSARSRTGRRHSGWASTGASGCAAFSSAIRSGEKRSCTWQAPSHSTISRSVTELMYEPRLRSGPKIIFSSAGNDSTIRRALLLVTSTSLRALTPIEVFTYEMTVWPGCAATNAANSSAGQLSAREQPASRSGISTVLSGQSTFTVSPMKLTPHITTTSASRAASAAFWASARESPT